MNKITKSLFLIFLLVFPSVAGNASDVLREAVKLYGNGLYSRAMSLLQTMPEYGDDAVVDGYAVLCAQKQKTAGYRTLAGNYLDMYPGSPLSGDVRLERAFDFFDDGQYDLALSDFLLLSPKRYPDHLKAEYFFKKGYCLYKTGNVTGALSEFAKVGHLPYNDFTAPSQFCTGYAEYEAGNFSDAVPWFERSDSDERLTSISRYYLVNCHFQQHHYDYVIDKGVRLYNSGISEERKAHLARIISESYLVNGDKEKAGEFYSRSADDGNKSRGDYFYAGSLKFLLGQWQEAIDNYGGMDDKTDSLGQIAMYNTALSYINLKNKVAALGAFKEAARMEFDRKMQEDAFFNYAKLSFDLNGDTSVFTDYIKTFSDSVRGEKIYSYMALAALADNDYQAAIDNYDKIDLLTGADIVNYVHANYIRGAELLDSGSYRRAVQCLKTVTYYSGRNDRVNQLARYYLGEAYYRNEAFEDAASQFRDLYNNSALPGILQGELIPYNAAYSYFRQKKYEMAAKWFGIYCSDGGQTVLKDALTRRADCLFALRRYKEAAAAYQIVLDKFFDVNDIYPYYQCAVASGLTRETGRKLELLENVYKADPAVPYYTDALFELGKTRQDRNQTDEAVKAFRKVVAADSTGTYAARATLEIGTLNRRVGNIDKALEAYKEVVEKMRDSGCVDDALLAIESIYRSQNTPEMYLQYLDSIGKGSVKSSEEREEMMFSSAEQYLFSGDCRKALAAFRDFERNYPSSARIPAVKFHIGECLKRTGDKVQACDEYRKVIEGGPGNYYARALADFAALNFELENFSVSHDAYKSLIPVVSRPDSLLEARTGLVRSAYRAKLFEPAVEASGLVMADTLASASLKRETGMIRAKSLLALSRRDEAFALLGTLSSDMSSPEGAEAAYMIIRDCFDKGDFAGVESKVYEFGGSGSGQQYWMAKSFVVLADSYIAQDKMKQAKATLQSIADAYVTDDDVLRDAKAKLEKLNGMEL